MGHEQADPDHPHAHVIPAALEKSIVKITEDGTYRYIKSNGIPNHRTGDFPNRSNPNAISAQQHEYRLPITPRNSGRATPKDKVIGVALNGIPFEPATAECYGQARGARPNPNCEWREEAIINGKGQLGLDQSNAHVQPNGTYHYHGIPYGLLSVLGKEDIVHVGYAADGFKIMVSRSGRYKPSYNLKSGTRPSGPGGRYNGKYTADYTFKAGHGDLDECNGTSLNGEYVYVLTKGFPFAPRCLMGQADTSFSRKKPSFGAGGHHRRRPPPPRPH